MILMQDFGLGLRRTRRSRLRSSNIIRYSKLTKYAFIGLVLFIFLSIGLFLWYGRDLPQPGKLAEASLGNSTRIYDRNGENLYSVFQDEIRSYVKLDKVPEIAQEATIATEDKDFYENEGFSITGLFRGLIIDPILRQRVTGGSTITQQLVKNVLLTSERTLPRKVKELILAVQVDKIYSKDEILEMYLNNVPYGGTAIGIDSASEAYFGKGVEELDLAEAAFLAGLPQAPSYYSPFSGNKYYVGRTEYVLNQMVKEKYITADQKEKALDKIEGYKFTQRNHAIKAPHFVMWVKQLAAERYGDKAVDAGGLQIHTTLDYEIQKEAEKIVDEEIEKLKGFRVSNGAAVVIDPKPGEILAMVGSKDYFDEDIDGNFN
ncbi:MAG: transglycosylase domain-containing protein, partial [Patescibacteria group bacterium]